MRGTITYLDPSIVLKMTLYALFVFSNEFFGGLTAFFNADITGDSIFWLYFGVGSISCISSGFSRPAVSGGEMAESRDSRERMDWTCMSSAIWSWMVWRGWKTRWGDVLYFFYGLDDTTTVFLRLVEWRRTIRSGASVDGSSCCTPRLRPKFFIARKSCLTSSVVILKLVLGELSSSSFLFRG